MHDLTSPLCRSTLTPTADSDIDRALDAAGAPHHDERGSLTTAQRVAWLKDQRDKWRACTEPNADQHGHDAETTLGKLDEHALGLLRQRLQEEAATRGDGGPTNPPPGTEPKGGEARS